MTVIIVSVIFILSFIGTTVMLARWPGQLYGKYFPKKKKEAV
jgi:hypothetical protein